MSGGVDSSVAAALLKEEGHIVTGVMMKIWDGDDSPGVKLRNSCYGPGETGNIVRAKKVAETLGIPLHVIDLSADFKSEVLAYVTNEYEAGRTPNPCLLCNRDIKFETLPEKAKIAGADFDYFATGHYTRVECNQTENTCLLKKGKDTEKDQSYFLAFLSREQLSRILFPVGEYTKGEVKDLARHYGFEDAERQESRDFIAAGYRSVLEDAKPGEIRNSYGELLGEHPGISSFTVGQRKGLGISNREPLYVTDIDPETGTITVGAKEELYTDTLTASGLNWLATGSLTSEMEVTAKIRYAHPEAEATITPLDGDRVKVTFRKPQMAVTPGQAVVFYRRDAVLGAGIIERKKT